MISHRDAIRDEYVQHIRAAIAVATTAQSMQTVLSKATATLASVRSITQTPALDCLVDCRFCICIFNVTFTGRDCQRVEDECQTGKHDCSPNAICKDLEKGFTCECKDGFNDALPSRPGRVCERSE